MIPFNSGISIEEYRSFGKYDINEKWMVFSADWQSELFSAKSYLKAGSKLEEPSNEVPFIAGIEGKSSIYDLGLIGKVKYVSNLNNFESASRVDFQLKSKYSIGDRWNSNLELSWNVFGESRASMPVSSPAHCLE